MTVDGSQNFPEKGVEPNLEAVHGSAVAPDFVARHFLVDRPRPELKSMNSPLRYTMSLARLFGDVAARNQMWWA